MDDNSFFTDPEEDESLFKDPIWVMGVLTGFLWGAIVTFFITRIF